MSASAPVRPSGLPATLRKCNVVFVEKAEAITIAACGDKELYDRSSTFSEVFVAREMPRYWPGKSQNALCATFKEVSVSFSARDSAKSCAESRRILFHDTSRSVKNLLDRSIDANASPPVSNSGCTLFNASASPIKFSDNDNAVRLALVWSEACVNIECARVDGVAASERPQNRKRNHPLHGEMDTSRIEEVKTPQHDGTPRSHVAGRELDASVGVVRDVVVVSELHETSFGPRIFLSLISFGGALLRAPALL